MSMLQTLSQEIGQLMLRWKLPNKIFFRYRFYDDASYHVNIWSSAKAFNNQANDRFLFETFGKLGEQIEADLISLGTKLAAEMSPRRYSSTGTLECRLLTKGMSIKHINQTTNIVWCPTIERKIPEIIDRMLMKELRYYGILNLVAETELDYGVARPFNIIDVDYGNGFEPIGIDSEACVQLGYVLDELVDAYPFHQFYQKGEDDTLEDRNLHLTVAAGDVRNSYFSGMEIRESYTEMTETESLTKVSFVLNKPEIEQAKTLLWA